MLFCRHILCPDDLSVCFLSFPFIHNQEIKENYICARVCVCVGGGGIKGESLAPTITRLAERFYCTSSQHSSPRC